MTIKINKIIGFHYLLTKIHALLFGFFGIEYISQEVISKIKAKSITHNINIFSIHNDDSVLCGCYCIAFIEYMVAAKTLLDHANLFLPNDLEKE